MKKSKFIKSTIILLIGGLITKILGMVIKIFMTRLVGTTGIGLYMLIMPTFMLLMTIAQMGLPVAISTLVARKSKNSKRLVFSIIPVSLLINGIIIITLLFTSNFISTTLLHEPRVNLSIICIGLVLPFISISSILRGVFFGKQQMFPHVISNITEDIIRLITLVVGIPIFLVYGLEYAVAFIVLSNIVSELTSILVLFFFIPKKFNISLSDFKPYKKDIKDVFDISLPTTGSRLIGNIGYFLEPIILTFVLLKIGYNNNFIIREYGVLNGYVMPLIMLPSFFTQAISQALIPVISESYYNGKKMYAKKKVREAIFLSLLVGIPSSIILFLCPDIFLKFIYNTTEGINYLRVLAPIFLIYYIQAPLTSVLQATSRAKQAMHGTLVGIIIRLTLLFSLSFLKVGMWGLLVGTIASVYYTTIHHYLIIRKLFDK